MKTGNFIREKRLQAELSQKAVGEYFNPKVTTQFISNLERGMVGLPANKVVGMAVVLKCEPREIVEVMCEDYKDYLTSMIAINSFDSIPITEDEYEDVA